MGKRIFLDYAATTPVDRRVLKYMNTYYKRYFANPSSIHTEGNITSNILDDLRSRVAKLIGVKSNEVIFTASGTESNNLAIRGLINGINNDDNRLFNSWKEIIPEILTTNIEHPATLETCKYVEGDCAEVTYIPVEDNGKIDVSKLSKYLNEKVLLLSIIWVNNEIGTLQDIKGISRELKKWKNDNGKSFAEPPYLHIDASQAPYMYDVNLDRLGADMMTLDSSKIYGPKGVGTLICKDHLPLQSIIFGGSQEFGKRAGTENLPLIAGFTKALEFVQEEKSREFERLSEIREYFITKLSKEIPEVQIISVKNGSPHILNICIPNANAEFSVIKLDEKGIACSSTTACRSNHGDGKSYVVEAINPECASSSLRFSFGRDTKKKDIDFTIAQISDII